MKCIIAITVMFFAARSACANPTLGLPLTRNAPVGYRIETREAHPGYLFILVRDVHQYDDAKKKREHSLAAEYIELTPDRPLVLRPNSDGEAATLVIIPRPNTIGNLAPKELLKAHPDLARQAVYQDFPSREEVPSWAGNEITITYRVQPTQSGDKLEVARTSWHPLWQWFAAALAVPAVVFVGGVLLLRRKRLRLLPATA